MSVRPLKMADLVEITERMSENHVQHLPEAKISNVNLQIG